ncbi:MAG: signal peptidase I [Methanoculleus horonobensis]|nr:signal peptidase I [Methanoculleus horonobensis]MDD4251527.1 signal peptidase I [Methanoculleus horonobensis]
MTGEGRPSRTVVYTGQSMYPTLRDRDIVICSAPRHGQLRRGDVVLFRSEKDGRWIVHRICDISGTVAATRGDANPSVDEQPLPLDAVEGRVIAVERRGRRVRVLGGWIGHWSAVLLRGYYRRRRRLWYLLRCGCRDIALPDSVRRLISPFIRVRVVEFKRADGTELHLFFGRWRIGLLRPADQEWRLSPPFGLILDRETLPRLP